MTPFRSDPICPFPKAEDQHHARPGGALGAGREDGHRDHAWGALLPLLLLHHLLLLIIISIIIIILTDCTGHLTVN